MESFMYNIQRRKMSDSVAIVSGGLDSTVLVYDMIDQGYTPHMLSFNYGQRHSRELEFAQYTASRLGLRHDIVDLTGLTYLISNSALTSYKEARQEQRQYVTGQVDGQEEIEVPEGHYAEDSMKATVVPNRNMIMLSIAGGVAINNKYRTIGAGMHGGDHFIYPDCRPPFINYVDRAILMGNEGFHNFETDDTKILFQSIFAPYITRTKADIAYRGIELKVPFEGTWSCYKGADKHCGRCGTCVERLEAIHAAEQRGWNNNLTTGKYDKTEYADDEFWKEAVNAKN